MARVGRIAGAILAESHGEYFLIGNTKTPCDWAAAGFYPPPTLDPTRAPLGRLEPRGEIVLAAPYLTLALEGDELARALLQRFVIERNGSVSERLWQLVLRRGDPDAAGEPEASLDVRWLGEIPAPIWHIVRDTVLRCV